jgi:hypothetical protein
VLYPAQPAGRPVLIFDLKQDYRHLVSERSDLLVLPWQHLRFNPLQPPPDVPARRWAQVLTEVFGHATALLSGSKNYLMQQLVHLYQHHDTEDDWPTLHDLTAALKDHDLNHVRKTANYRDTVVNRLDGMLLTAGDIFATPSGHISPDILAANVVFEFDGLSTDLQNFLMEALFTWVYEHRVAQGDRGDGLRHVFVLDEGKRVFSAYKERQDAAGLPTIDEITAKMREFGEGLLVADQEPAKLTDSIKANTHTKLLLPMGDHSQFRSVADTMDLTQRQRRIAARLDTGEAVLQVGGTDPVHVHLDDYDIDKEVTDTDLQDRFRTVWQAGQTSTIEGGDEADTPALDTAPDGTAGDEADQPLSAAADRLLRDVAEHPYRKLSDRYERFSSRYKGNQAKAELVDRRLVREKTVRKKYGRPTLLELTSAGRDHLVANDIEVSHEGRGGVVHRYWQHFLQDQFEDAGYAVELEDDDADLGIRTDQGRVAVEVAMAATDREIDHVKRRLAEGFDAVFIGCPSEAVQDELREMLQEARVDRECVDVRLLRQLQDMD